MNIIYSLFLGVLQGLTEFIPVSSSGHLVLAQSIISDFEQPGVLFDVFVHAGTLFSIIFYFRERILSLFQKNLTVLIIGSIPAAFAGLFFQDKIESFFTSTYLVGMALMLTGVLNYITDLKVGNKKKISLSNSFLIGIFQALALVPGISRSGATISAASTLGIDKKRAAEFSFLLSVPAVAGANILQFFSHGGESTIDLSFYAVGFLSAFASGYLAIKIMMKFLVSRNFKVFAIYCIAMGLLAILY